VGAFPLSLFATGEPALASGVALERHALDELCWVDVGRGWLSGGDALLDELLHTLAWRQSRRLMWGNWVDEPRLTTGVRLATAPAVLRDIARALTRTYAALFDSCWCNHYRDGRDSVAWHGDQVARELPEALVATVSLGEPRLFALRPKGGGRAIHYHLGHGDLVVMGGTSQRTWDHAVPKVARAGPRVTVMFRPAWAARFSQKF